MNVQTGARLQLIKTRFALGLSAELAKLPQRRSALSFVDFTDTQDVTEDTGAHT